MRESVSFYDTLITSVMFQIVWFDVLLFQMGIAYFLIGLMTLHLLFRIREHRARLILVLACLFFVGVIFDSLLAWSGVFAFGDDTLLFAIPAWLAKLWLAFIISLPLAFYWIIHKPLKMAFMFGLLAPLSYAAGRAFGHIDFSNYSVIFIAIVWFIVGLLASLSLKQIFLGKEGAWFSPLLPRLIKSER